MEQPSGYKFERREREPGAEWEAVEFGRLVRILKAAYRDASLALGGMLEAAPRSVITSGFADYRAIEEEKTK